MKPVELLTSGLVELRLYLKSLVPLCLWDVTLLGISNIGK